MQPAYIQPLNLFNPAHVSSSWTQLPPNSHHVSHNPPPRFTVGYEFGAQQTGSTWNCDTNNIVTEWSEPNHRRSQPLPNQCPSGRPNTSFEGLLGVRPPQYPVPPIMCRPMNVVKDYYSTRATHAPIYSNDPVHRKYIASIPLTSKTYARTDMCDRYGLAVSANEEIIVADTLDKQIKVGYYHL